MSSAPPAAPMAAAAPALSGCCIARGSASTASMTSRSCTAIAPNWPCTDPERSSSCCCSCSLSFVAVRMASSLDEPLLDSDPEWSPMVRTEALARSVIFVTCGGYGEGGGGRGKTIFLRRS